MMTAGGESTDGWGLLIRDLADRGLKCPQLIVSDGNIVGSTPSGRSTGRTIMMLTAHGAGRTEV
jgi:hypothetical protein